MPGRRWLFLWLFVSTAMLLGIFQYRHARFRRAQMRASAAQWVLTTAWMADQFQARHGHVPVCGGLEPPCHRVLGWMNRPLELKGYALSVRRHGLGYFIEAVGQEGRWTLEQGSPLLWAGTQMSLPSPQGRRQKLDELGGAEGSSPPPDLPSPGPGVPR